MAELSEAGYQCLRSALTLARGDSPPKTVKALRVQLAEAGYTDAEIDEALDTWAGSVVVRTMPDTAD